MASVEVVLTDCGAVTVTFDRDITEAEAISVSRKAARLIEKHRYVPEPSHPDQVSNDGGRFGFSPSELWGPDPDATITCKEGRNGRTER